jgi:hypothetical protein
MHSRWLEVLREATGSDVPRRGVEVARPEVGEAELSGPLGEALVGGVAGLAGAAGSGGTCQLLGVVEG